VERGQRLKTLREALKLSQQKAADAAGVERTYLSNIETGRLKFQSSDIQQKLATVYGVAMGSLVEYAHGRMPLEALMAGQAPFATLPKTDPAPPQVRERTVVYEPRYRNLGIAIKRLAEAGEGVAPDMITELENSFSALSEEDPPVAMWMELVKGHVRRRKEAADATEAQIRKALGGVAVQDSDVAKPRVKAPRR